MDYAAVPVLVRWEIGYLIIFATFIAYYLSKPNGPMGGTLGMENPGESGKSSPNVGTK